MTMQKLNLFRGIIAFFFIIVFSQMTTSCAHGRDLRASSCSASDIQAAIDTCVNFGGGTVTIPECDYTNRWRAGDRVMRDVGTTELRIVGQGTSKTRIGYADDQSQGFMWVIVGNGLKEFGGMYLEGNPSIGANRVDLAFTIYEAEDCRVHDIETKNFRGPTGVFCSTRNLVVDHCVFGNVLYDGTYHFYVYDTANVPWSDEWPGNFGSVNYNVFFEDNQFGGAHHPISLFERAKVVFRHNTVTIPPSAYGPSGGYQGNLDSHSPGYGSCSSDGIPDSESYEHGGQAYEIYNNHFTRTDGVYGYAIRLRSGAAIITNNTFNSIYHAISLVLETNTIGGDCDAGNGYPQDHDFGPGTSGCTAGDGCCDKIEHIYIWDNTFTNVYNNLLIEDLTNGGLSQNIDYFLRAPALGQDNFVWQPYAYPHPLVTGNYPPRPPENLKIIDIYN